MICTCSAAESINVSFFLLAACCMIMFSPAVSFILGLVGPRHRMASIPCLTSFSSRWRALVAECSTPACMHAAVDLCALQAIRYIGLRNRIRVVRGVMIHTDITAQCHVRFFALGATILCKRVDSVCGYIACFTCLFDTLDTLFHVVGLKNQDFSNDQQIPRVVDFVFVHNASVIIWYYGPVVDGFFCIYEWALPACILLPSSAIIIIR